MRIMNSLWLFAGWLLVAGCQREATPAAVGPAGAPPPLSVYPDSEQAFNPRLPCVPPVAGGAQGKGMQAEAEFTYRLAPFVVFPSGGELRAAVRGSLPRRAKSIFTLLDGQRCVSLQVSRAAEGRIPMLVYAEGGKELQVARFSPAFSSAWTRVVMQWSATNATCLIGDQTVARIAWPSPFAPTRVRLQADLIDELQLVGDGRFELAWEDGYAAQVTPASEGRARMARLFGFDSYVVSQQPAARDYPMIQAINGGDEAATVAVDFAITSEVRRVSQRWTQRLSVPARSAVMLPIAFPLPLESDVYHLKAWSSDVAPELAEERHFMFVARRPEPAGEPKFGLHLGGGDIFGCWPDALPIHLYHYYANWGYIQGPVWIKDNQGENGLDPSVPAAEWNWAPQLDWAMAMGLEPYICLNAGPLVPWMCDKIYAPTGMPGPWPSATPNHEAYRKFAAACAERYGRKARLFEVQNEPNSWPKGGYPPADYVEIARDVFEGVHAVNPDARVYGICGTGDFVPWMTRVLDAGGAAFMDRFSFHTYTATRLPERAGVPAKLAEVRALARKHGKPLRFVNSETGVYTALREEVDRPIPPPRLAELIEQRAPSLYRGGWIGHALDEQQGGISTVRNAVYNFLAGAEYFTFFGWNPEWPSAGWRTNSNDECWAIISSTPDGRRTPSLRTLAVGVLTAQLEGALTTAAAAPIDQDGVLGGRFAKRNGGEVLVLWSAQGRRSVLLQTPEPTIETVSMLGESRRLKAAPGAGGSLHQIEVDVEPLYLHLSQPGATLLPSPVAGVEQVGQEGDVYRLRLTLLNPYDKPWRGQVVLAARAGWSYQPEALTFALQPQARADLQVVCRVPAALPRGSHTIEASVPLPDGAVFSFPLAVTCRPTVAVPPLPEGLSLNDLKDWPMPGGPLRLDQAGQVMYGAPPLLASLQEERYWKGPSELSAEAKVGYNAHGLFVLVQVHDAHPRAPETWPGVGGSCVELFFDFRPPAGGLGHAVYGQGVHQVILRPSLAEGEAVAVWTPTAERFGGLRGAVAQGARINRESYWVALCIPWADIGQAGSPGGVFGLDIGLDGSWPDQPGRKSQLMLYGTAASCQDASLFGRATLAPPPRER